MSYSALDIGRVTVVSDATDGLQFWVDHYAPPHKSLLWRYWEDGSVAIYPPHLPNEVGEVFESLPLPSETLQSLLRHFHEHRAVAPLVDRLIEEYPDLEPYLAGVLEPASTLQES